MNDLKILVLVCVTILIVTVGAVLLFFLPMDAVDAVERSTIVRNYILTASAPVGIILALWRLYSIEKTLSNDNQKLSIERRMSAIKLLNSPERATKEVAIDLINRLRNEDAEDKSLLTNALYRFFQEEYRENRLAARLAFKEACSEDVETAYKNWLNRPVPTTSPKDFLLDFSRIKEDRLHMGIYELSLRGRNFSVTRDLTFWECDLSDAKIIVEGGCSFVGCDLSRSNLILRDVKKTSDLSLSHCNVSSLKLEPALPVDFDLAETRRSGWFFEGSPPLVGDYFGMPNLEAKVPFSFEDSGSRSVPRTRIPSLILGETDYGRSRGLLSSLEQDDYSLAEHALSAGE